MQARRRTKERRKRGKGGEGEEMRVEGEEEEKGGNEFGPEEREEGSLILFNPTPSC